MHKNIKTCLITLASAGLISQMAAADLIRISVTGTADSTSMGYTIGQSYTFNWVINDGYTAGSSQDIFNSSRNLWDSDITSDPILWDSISGDGLVGTYSRPSTPGAPFDYAQVRNDDPDVFSLWAGNDDHSGSSLGMTVNGVELAVLSCSSLNIGADFSFPETYVNPADYWAAYAGAYTPSSGSIHVEDESSNIISFSPTSVSVQSIPEPATLAFMGLFGAAVIAIRRIFMV